MRIHFPSLGCLIAAMLACVASSSPTFADDPVLGQSAAAIADETPALEPPDTAEPESPTASIERAIRFYQARVERHPKVALNYIHLANQLVRKAKDHGDEACYPLAEQALQAALKLRPNDREALFALAGVSCSRHQFREGLGFAKQVLEQDPSHMEAMAIVGDAQMELGDYSAAEASYGKIEQLFKQPAPGLWVRQAHLAEVRGQTAVAQELLIRAVQNVVEGQEVSERTPRKVWYQVRLGHFYLDHGRLDDANTHLESAVAAQPKYFLALAGLAELRTAQGRYDEALAAYGRTIAVVPDPIFFMATGDIHTKMGRTEEARRDYESAEKLILESDATPAEYSRELSLFYSHRNLKSARALELAKTDLTVRQDIHAYDSLAWSLYRNGRFDEAAEAIGKALQPGSKEARLHFHAGLIHHQLGQLVEARTHLEQALATNPQFGVLEADEARRVLATLPAKPTSATVSQ